jgi:hypothetical protein
MSNEWPTNPRDIRAVSNWERARRALDDYDIDRFNRSGKLIDGSLTADEYIEELIRIRDQKLKELRSSPAYRIAHFLSMCFIAAIGVAVLLAIVFALMILGASQ